MIELRVTIHHSPSETCTGDEFVLDEGSGGVQGDGDVFLKCQECGLKIAYSVESKGLYK